MPAERSLFGRCSWTVRRDACESSEGGPARGVAAQDLDRPAVGPHGATISRHIGFSSIGLSTAPAGVDSPG